MAELAVAQDTYSQYHKDQRGILSDSNLKSVQHPLVMSR